MPDINKAWDTARAYQNRGFFNPTAPQKKLSDTQTLHIEKKKRYVLTGTLSARESAKTPDGKPCILITLAVPDFKTPAVSTIRVTGANMLTIIRVKIGTTLSIVRTFRDNDPISQMVRLATPDDTRHDTSGMWIVRPDLPKDMHPHIVRMKQARTRLRIRHLMSSNMCLIADEQGRTQTILRNLLKRA